MQIKHPFNNPVIPHKALQLLNEMHERVEVLETTGGGGDGGTAPNVQSVHTRTGAVVAENGDYNAGQVDFDNIASGLTATNTQEAIDELAASAGTATGTNVPETSLTLQNQWANFGGTHGDLTYSLTGGIVHVAGVVTAGTVGNAITTLPAGFRPTKQLILLFPASQGQTRIDVYSNGEVIPHPTEFTGSPQSYIGINFSFRASA